jgi:hypothetical protein
MFKHLYTSLHLNQKWGTAVAAAAGAPDAAELAALLWKEAETGREVMEKPHTFRFVCMTCQMTV